MLRTHTCGELNQKSVGKQVKLAAWLHSKRSHGKLVFFDLRDRYGITQCVTYDPNLLDNIKKESVVLVTGKVQKRVKGQENKGMETGEIELLVEELVVLSHALQTPFKVEDEVLASEDLRFKYRYLDLRRKPAQDLIILRSKVDASIREYMSSKDFVNIETPFLAKSTPEGARDYLVPSRIHNGQFYALPQSPQIYKQLCMIAGFDKYYQIVKCFRDEDLRADRQPEFTQLDIEMSFVEQDDVLLLVEDLLKKVWKDVLNINIKIPFTRIPYDEVLNKYGSDKPDTRFGLELQDVTQAVKGCGFKVFENVEKTGAIKAIVAPGELINKKTFKKLEILAKEHKSKGLVELRYEKEITGSIAGFLSENSKKELIKFLKPKKGDAIFIVADSNKDIVNESLGALRNFLGDLIYPKREGFNFLWVVDFPLFVYSDEEERYVSNHHPFTSPINEHLSLLEKDKGKIKSYAYDCVLNGSEIGGGSIRIANPEIQARVFKALGISDEDAKKKFGFFLEALQYGTPPHGGIAFGLDRLVALIARKDSIRDVIPFPKNKYAQSLMVSSPSSVADKQLDELGIKVKK